MTRLVPIILSICFFCILPPCVSDVAADDKALLNDIAVHQENGNLLLSCNISNCFTEEMDKAIESGIPNAFIIFVRLYESRNVLWNKKVADVKATHEIRYDTFKSRYKIKISEKNDEVVVVNDFMKAKEIMSMVDGLSITDLKALTKGHHYQVRIMAELDTIKLPLKLHNVFFFLSLWDFETEWYSIDFEY